MSCCGATYCSCGRAYGSPNATSLNFGTCLIHGYHGQLVCPTCSSSAAQPVVHVVPKPPEVRPTILELDIAARLARLEELVTELIALLREQP